MPLFMDMHQASDYDSKPTVEDIKKNHIADLNVQSRYGVKFLQYWINEDAGLVFCLMEAPDKEACAAVHREAHGAMPCNIIELKGGDYQLFMGNEGRVNPYDIVETSEGKLDSGYRIILAIDIISPTIQNSLYERINDIVQSAGGRPTHRPGHRELIAFTSPSAAIDSALKMIADLQHSNASAEIRIGISAGQPLTRNGDFFEEGIQLANRLCDIAQNGQIVISSLANQLIGRLILQAYRDDTSLKLLEAEDEQFLNQLMQSISSTAFQPYFNLETLYKELGLSKSGLYRRITLLTGRSPNDFIQEIRLQKGFHLMRSKQGNVTQVAFDVGYTNPSYFSQNFQKRFGIAPLQVLKTDVKAV